MQAQVTHAPPRGTGREAPPGAGWQASEPWRFDFPSLRGLPLSFWVLMCYLLLELSAIDEYMIENDVAGLRGVVEMARPRLVLGLLALALSVGTLTEHGEGLARIMEFRQSRWLVAFGIACLASMLWAYNGKVAIAAMRDYAPSMLSFFLLLATVRSRRRLLILLLVMSLGIGIFMSISLYEWFSGRMEYRMGVVRMIGIGYRWADANALAASVVYGLPIIAWIVLHCRTRFIRLCGLGYAPLAIYTILKSSSRSGLVLFMVTGLWGVFFLPKGKPRRIVVTVGIVLVIGLFLTLSDHQRERLEGIFDPDTYDHFARGSAEQSARGRIDGLVVGWKIFAANPLFGVGPGNWKHYRAQRVDGSIMEAHNLVGQLIASLGLVGTITFVGFVYVSLAYGFQEFRRRRRSPDPWDRAVAALLSAVLFTVLLLLVSGLGGHNLYRPNWFWLSAVMIIACTCQEEDE